MSKINVFLNKLGSNMYTYRPEISLGIGIICGVGALVCTYLATKKEDKIKARADKRVQDIKDKVLDSTQPEYTEEVSKKDIAKAAAQTTLEWVWNFAPAITFEAISIGLIGFSHVDMRKRNIGLSTLLAASTASFKQYRENVINEYGEEVDEKLYYGYHEEERKVSKVKEDGSVEEFTEKVKVANTIPECYTLVFSRWADKEHTIPNGYYYINRDEANRIFIKFKFDELNRLLKRKEGGYLTAATVYSEFGMIPPEESNIVGWRYDPKNPYIDNEIKARIKEAYIDGSLAFIMELNIQGDVVTPAVKNHQTKLKEESIRCRANAQAA